MRGMRWWVFIFLLVLGGARKAGSVLKDELDWGLLERTNIVF